MILIEVCTKQAFNKNLFALSVIHVLYTQALIEILDQVEDVISVEESVCKDEETFLEAERCPEADLAVNQLTINSNENINSKASNCYFLVLEVSVYTFYSFLLHKNIIILVPGHFVFLHHICPTGFRKAWVYCFIWASFPL